MPSSERPSGPPLRFLILSASVGAGHTSAAQALEAAFRLRRPAAFIQHEDVLNHTNSSFRRLYGNLYLDLINSAPQVLGFLYDALDRPNRRNDLGDKLRFAAEKVNLRGLIPLLEAQPWDAIVNTHFLPAEVIAYHRRRKGWRLPHFIVTTDFQTHRLWVNEPCEGYFTANHEGADYLAHFGVDPALITATGIPVHPRFSEKKDRSICLKAHGLTGKAPVVLQLAGGFGVGPVEEISNALLDIPFPIELAVVAGKNEALKRALDGIQPPARHRLRVIGFTKQMDELMAAADLIVSKPGGLTTSEALASGTPMAIVNPVPGQETLNSDFLLESGAAVKIQKVATLTGKIAGVLKDKARLAELKAHARQAGRPQAAFDIADRIIEWVEKRA